MADIRSLSIFDIVGPIMVGPSSSHTAGAVRLGLMARALLGAIPDFARIELHGSFSTTGKGHGTDKALVAGLLKLSVADERVKESFDLAQKAGFSFEFAITDLGESAHPNSVRFVLSKQGLETVTITGSSTGGGLIEISEVLGYPVSFDGSYETLLIRADDQPGTINAVTGWLVNQNINVAFLKVGRERRGGEAMMTIETDQPIPDELIRSMESLAWVRWVRRVPQIGF